MSERKVLNKYYPPDFDPNKIPKLKRPKNRQFNIRIMAPFNMRCGTCGEYIYKGKKFNSRQERVEDEDYLGLMIFRFYIKCPRCVAEISFKTDPEKTDYELEGGATRNFEALRTAEMMAEREIKEKEEEEKNNPMKVLENRTKSSLQEMEMIETLEELRELNSRHAKVDHESMIKLTKAYEEQLNKLQDDEDEAFIRSVFGQSSSGESIKRLHDGDEDEDDDSLASASSTPKVPRLMAGGKPTDLLTQDSIVSETPYSLLDHSSSSAAMTKPSKAVSATTKPPAIWQKSVGGLSSKKSMLGLVRKKQPTVTKGNKTPSEATAASDITKPEKISLKETVPTSSTASELRQEVKNNEKVEIKKMKNTESTNTLNEKTNLSSKEKPQTITSDVKTPHTIVSDKEIKSKTETQPSALGLLGAYSDTDSSEGVSDD